MRKKIVVSDKKELKSLKKIFDILGEDYEYVIR